MLYRPGVDLLSEGLAVSVRKPRSPRDPRPYIEKRLEILQRDDWACTFCGDKEKTLHVHHRQYIKGRMPWEYEEEFLTTLCFECHEEITNEKRLFDASSRAILEGDHEQVRGYIDMIVARRDCSSIGPGSYEYFMGAGDHMGVTADELIASLDKDGKLHYTLDWDEKEGELRRSRQAQRRR